MKKTKAEIRERQRKWYKLYIEREGVREKRAENNKKYRIKNREKLNRERRTPEHRARERLRCNQPKVKARKIIARKKHYLKNKQ